MGVFPLSIAMMAAQISAISMLGISGEAYIRGMFVVLLYSGGFTAIPLLIYCFLPVYFELKVVSIYEVIARLFKNDSKINDILQICIK